MNTIKLFGTLLLGVVSALLIGGALVVNAAKQQNREITITCEDIKIVFEIADKAKWSLKVVTDKRGTTYNCQILSDR